MSLYREAAKAQKEAASRFTMAVDRVYGEAAGPPYTGKWSSFPLHRRLYRTMASGGIELITFGWENRTNHVGVGYWVRSWTSDRYRSLSDSECVRQLIGRTPGTPLDELSAMMEVEEALGDNEPELAEEFKAANKRAIEMAERVRVIWRTVTETVTRHLANTQEWRMGESEGWRRITFEDGMVFTVTSAGKVMPRDALIEMEMSLEHPAVVSHSSYPNSLEERQSRARGKV